MSMKRPWLVLWIVIAMAVVIWIFFGNTIHAAYERHVMSSMKEDLPIGLSRLDAYSRIKAHGLVAFNWMYLRENVEHSDEWPQPSQTIHFRVLGHTMFVWPFPEMPVERPIDVQHPWVRIEFVLDSPSFFCVNKAILKILFDKSDRISQVQELPIRQECTPL